MAAARTLFESAQPRDGERVPGAITDSYTDAYVLDEEAHCLRDLGQHGKALELSQQFPGLRGSRPLPPEPGIRHREPGTVPRQARRG
jgi:hypothetical protein